MKSLPVTPPVTLRGATGEDDAFLYELFKAVRMPDFAHVAMPPAQLEMLMKMQYAGQKYSYTAQYPDSNRDIVLVDGVPAGRISIHRTSSEHRLVDIALLPEYQNRGIGTELLKNAIASAQQAGVPLACSVATSNPGSLRFHKRLGFQIVSHDEMYYYLTLEP